MKHVLVLGAGLVARPYVDYMLQRGYRVTVASRTLSKAERLVAGHPNGEARAFDIERQPELLPELVEAADLVVSLLPYIYHVKVARECLRHRKPLVTTSYVSDEMRKLDGEARRAGIILLNECGVDPGQDHMSAMRIIHRAKAEGGRIILFTSFCGGLPAPEANTNPFGYKLSWSPRGVLLAGRNSARFLRDGKEVFIPSEQLFENCHREVIPGLGEFEAYPNRDSLQYIEIYEIPEVQTMLRGTLRYPSWCATMLAIGRLGLLDLEERDFTGMTYGDLVRQLVRAPGGADPKEAAASFLKLSPEDPVIERFEWLGLFSDQAIPPERKTPLDALCHLFEEKLRYEPGERDMLVMQHTFHIEYKDGRQEQVRSTLVDYGIPHGDSSMSRTVALPAAIASRLILEGEVKLTGVHIPIRPELYKPILEELEQLGIRFEEEVTPL